MLTALTVSLAGYAFMMLAPRAAIGMFTSDAELIASSARVLRVMVLFIPLASLQITRITSYNVCYTKLLRAWRTAPCPGCAAPGAW